MKYRDLPASLDDLDVAVMICDDAGLITYKNPVAMKQIRLPKRATHVAPHLQSPVELLDFSMFVRPRKPAILTIDTGDRLARALVCTFGETSPSSYLWVFPSFLQMTPYTESFTAAERNLLEYAYEICDVVRCIDQKSRLHSSQRISSINKRIDERMDAIINGIFSSPKGQNQFDGYLPCFKCTSLLSEGSNNILDRIGFNVHCSISSTAVSSKQARLLHFGTVTSFFAHFLQFCLLCSNSGGVTVSITENEDCVKLKTKFTCMYPPFYIQNCNSYEQLAELSPKTVIDVAIIKAIAQSCGYSLSFSVVEDSIDNTSVEITIPIVKSDYFLVLDDPFTDILRQRDTDMYMFNLFRKFH